MLLIFHLASYISIYTVYFGMDNSSNTVLTKCVKLLLFSKLFPILMVVAAIFLYNIIKTIPFDTEAHEDHDGSMQKAVQEMMAELQAIVCQGVAKNTGKKVKTKEGDFPCKLQ